MSLPTGTVTFLFTDIEGSTKLWDSHPLTMPEALARHDALMHQAVTAHDGIVFKTIGDAFCAAFATAPQALLAALIAQQTLQSEPWPDDILLHVRMALHTGTTVERDSDYFGPPLNRVARLLSTGHGGQVLVSDVAYDLCRDTLLPPMSFHDLGEHRLRDLARPEQVFQLCHPDLESEFPPLKSLNSLPNNLPIQLTSFVGREKELGIVKDLLSKTRLLTLTGSGGCGKTRLSLQTAADVLDGYPDGVWLVELAPLTDPDLVPQTIANMLGVKEQTGKTYTLGLTEHLKSKTLLLVLDNCEHVLNACAKLADTLLRQCPNVKVLASSREGLGIAGETSYRIPPLSLPDPKQTQTPESLSQYEAVQLFVERAMASLPAFAATNANAPALASVCHRLDGIPLAIELAAARVRSLSVEEINSKLDNLFRLLTGGSKTALPRQQTLRALIDWSYGLLTAQEKSLLSHLSVFSGGWTLSAAETVCAGNEIEDWEVLDLMTSLVDKSLVQPDEAEGHTRYRFLETVRQYARDRLAEGAEGFGAREQHRDYFLAFAKGIEPKLKGPEQGQWLSVLETEHDNLRQVLTFCLEDPNSSDVGLKLGGALIPFWSTRGHLSEGRERLIALLSRPKAQDHTAARGAALHGAGVLAWMQGDYALTLSVTQESLAIARELGEKNGIAKCLNNLGLLASDQGEYRLARMLYEEGLTIHRELGDRRGVANILGNLAVMATDQGDYTSSRSLLEESLAIYRELEDKGSIAWSLSNLGVVITGQGNYTLARSLLEDSLAIHRELRDKNGIAISLNALGSMVLKQGDYTLGRSFFEESLAIRQELGDRNDIALSLGNLGVMATEQEDYILARSLCAESLTIYRELEDKEFIAALLESFAALAVKEERTGRGAHLWGAAEALREAIGVPIPPNNSVRQEEMNSVARASLGEEAFASAWAAGRVMSIEEAVEYALGE